MNTVGAFINGSQSLRGSAPAINSASKNNIRQSNDNSQEKSSNKVQNSMRDSVSRKLTEAQQEYFKDSKVQDADGFQSTPPARGATCEPTTRGGGTGISIHAPPRGGATMG